MARIHEKRHSLGELMALVTTNPARVLNFPRKGNIEVGADGNVLIVDRDFNLLDVICGGRVFMRSGEVTVRPRYEKWSNRFGYLLKV